ncbi:MAG: hypothetical protein IH586_01995 [Anaerolineaceae bacterium]|nr:hypothetical protein [Anaerolineaceae bacterium]
MIRLSELIRPYGVMTPTGSYALDVMAYPDIDVYVPQISVRAIFEIGAAMAEVAEVKQVVFEKSNNHSLPGGLYLKPRIVYGNWGRPWKVDIWSIDDETLKAKVALMDGFCKKMTPALREKILNYKQAVMTIDMRTPMSSGYYIYRAFLDEGLVDFPDVTSYLFEHGIKIY